MHDPSITDKVKHKLDFVGKPLETTSVHIKDGMENITSMDKFSYDLAIARWVVQDPVIHHSMSPYNAFDNNPVFYKDPSGADAMDSGFWEGKDFLAGMELVASGGQGIPVTALSGHGKGKSKTDNEKDCCDDKEKPSVGEIIGAVIRGWWSSMFGGGRDDNELLLKQLMTN